MEGAVVWADRGVNDGLCVYKTQLKEQTDDQTSQDLDGHVGHLLGEVLILPCRRVGSELQSAKIVQEAANL